MKKLIALMAVLALLTMSISYADGWKGRQDRGKQMRERVKERGRSLGQAAHLGKVWFVITSPMADPKGKLLEQAKVEEQNGQFVVNFVGEDGVKATFPVKPRLVNSFGMPGGVRYNAVNPNQKMAYSVLYMKDRVGLPSDPNKVWDKLQDRFNTLSKKGVKVSSQPAENVGGKGTVDRTTVYDLSGKKGAVTLVERVIVTPKGLVIVDALGPSGQKAGAAFVKGTALTPGTTVPEASAVPEEEVDVDFGNFGVENADFSNLGEDSGVLD